MQGAGVGVDVVGKDKTSGGRSVGDGKGGNDVTACSVVAGGEEKDLRVLSECLEENL